MALDAAEFRKEDRLLSNLCVEVVPVRLGLEMVATVAAGAVAAVEDDVPVPCNAGPIPS